MTERDDAVSRRYRELPAEEPPRALDEAILAASRRAADARPAPLVAPTGRRRWYVPLAAAAVIVLAVGLTLRVQFEQPEEESYRQKEPASPVAKIEEKLKEEKPQVKAAPERRARAMTAPSSRAEAPSQFPDNRAAREAPAPIAPQAPAMAQMRAAPAPAPRSDDAMARDRAAGVLSSGAAAKRLQEAGETPQKALERIIELRKAGKDDEADKALAEFRKRYPDYKIPEAMRERVERR